MELVLFLFILTNMQEFIQSLIYNNVEKNKSTIWILTCIQLNAKLFCVIFTRFTLLESFSFTNLLTVFVCGNHPLIPLIYWVMNFLNIWEVFHLVCSLPPSHYTCHLEITLSFLWEFFFTTDNNFDLESYLKNLTRPSRTIIFKTSSPSIN